MGGWEYEDKTLALLWESEGVGIAAKTRMAHGLEIQVEKLNEVGGVGRQLGRHLGIDNIQIEYKQIG